VRERQREAREEDKEGGYGKTKRVVTGRQRGWLREDKEGGYGKAKGGVWE